MFSLVERYFGWLQKDNPTGDVQYYPIIKNNYQSEIIGLYLVGDITGLPLLKFATKQGHEVISKIAQELAEEKATTQAATQVTTQTDYDVAIIGAGAAGLSAALQAKKENLKYIVLEANRIANTILNFPSGKLIFAEPTTITSPSILPVTEATKEDTLTAWYKVLEQEKLSICEGAKVQGIKKNSDGIFEVLIENAPSLFARKIILAIGQSANSRKLNIKGEKLAKVSNKLYSPLDYQNQNILVVGGGDSAIEAALALVETGNNVTLSYRQERFFRLKPANATKTAQYIKENKLKAIFNSQVKEIHDQTVTLIVGKKDVTLPNDVVSK